MSNRLSDHDLTELVERAASGAVNSAAGHRGTPAWDALDAGAKNRVREAALPYIFHGTKALAELGYRKPRTITTREEVEALPEGSVLIDSAGDVASLAASLWCSYETAPMTHSRMAKYLPALVIHEAAA